MKRLGLLLGWLMTMILILPPSSWAAEMGKFTYDDFKKPRQCGACHHEIYQEWEQSLMAQSFIHPWDDVEYFKLALSQALKLEKVAGVKAGCVACHGPLAFLTGDIPPKQPQWGTRANEGVSCEICHSITGSAGKEPFNFSYEIEPGEVKYGNRRDARAKFHETKYSAFVRSPELCATCHDEQSPYGAWVKETYREWKASPYGQKGIRCQDCHMYYAPGKSATAGKQRNDIAHHVFHGPHFKNKLAGAVDIALYTNRGEVTRGATTEIRAELFNGKVGHSIPSGSSEERMLWLEVKATDGKGHTFDLPLNKKGFAGEEYTIADSKAVAYNAMGEIMEVKGYKGISRDGNVPDGARIFRRPFFDPQGRMTICQWYTAENTQIDYRIGPLETKTETYILTVPKDFSGDIVTVVATLYYSLVPSSLGEFLELPAYSYEPRVVNSATMVLSVR